MLWLTGNESMSMLQTTQRIPKPFKTQLQQFLNVHYSTELGALQLSEISKITRSLKQQSLPPAHATRSPFCNPFIKFYEFDRRRGF